MAVVGGGPAGVLAAIYLAQQQYDVEVQTATQLPDKCLQVDADTLVMVPLRRSMSSGHGPTRRTGTWTGHTTSQCPTGGWVPLRRCCPSHACHLTAPQSFAGLKQQAVPHARREFVVPGMTLYMSMSALSGGSGHERLQGVPVQGKPAALPERRSAGSLPRAHKRQGSFSMVAPLLPASACGLGFCQQSSAKAWVDQVLVERMELVCHMVDEAARLVPDQIQFNWSHACTVSHYGCSRNPALPIYAISGCRGDSRRKDSVAASSMWKSACSAAGRGCEGPEGHLCKWFREGRGRQL